MEHKLDKIDEEKRKKLVNSGYAEFSALGLKRSSLNRILKNAEISKGFFYHYFENKNIFFDFLVEYGIKIIVKKLNDISILDITDFIQRLQSAALHKVVIAKEYPKLFDFLTAYLLEISQEEYFKMSDKITGNMTERVLTENIDYSLFKDDVPIDVAMKVVNRYIAQIQQEISTKIHIWDINQIMTYYNDELEALKSVVYKKGE